MLACVTSSVPQCGYSSLSTVIPFVIGSMLSNAGLEVSIENLVNACPSRQKLQDLVTNNAVNTIMLTQYSIVANPHMYIYTGKGNKKGNKNLAKYVCWYDALAKQVKTFFLDVDRTDEDTDEIATALLHSIKRVYSPNAAV